MIVATAMTPPACYASVARYYAVNPEERGGVRTRVLYDGDYALAQWVGHHGGGETAFRRRGGRWCVLTNGGGEMRAAELAHYGVPRATAERLIARMRRSAR